MILRANHLNV